MKNVLLLSDINFWEDSSGHRARLKALIAYLSRQVNLTVVNTGSAAGKYRDDLKAKLPGRIFVLEKAVP